WLAERRRVHHCRSANTRGFAAIFSDFFGLWRRDWISVLIGGKRPASPNFSICVVGHIRRRRFDELAFVGGLASFHGFPIAGSLDFGRPSLLFQAGQQLLRKFRSRSRRQRQRVDDYLFCSSRIPHFPLWQTKKSASRFFRSSGAPKRPL